MLTMSLGPELVHSLPGSYSAMQPCCYNRKISNEYCGLRFAPLLTPQSLKRRQFFLGIPHGYHGVVKTSFFSGHYRERKAYLVATRCSCSEGDQRQGDDQDGISDMASTLEGEAKGKDGNMDPMASSLIVGDLLKNQAVETQRDDRSDGELNADLTWLQAQLRYWVLPVIRVLNGSTLKSPEVKVIADDNEGTIDILGTFLRFLTGSAVLESNGFKLSEKLHQAEADFFTFSGHLGKYLLIMVATGAIAATGYELAGGDPQDDTLLWCSWLAGIIIGSMIGAEKVLERHFRSGPRNVVITGSTRGLGKALAREFLLAGDRVIISSRSSDSIKLTVQELEQEITDIPLFTIAANDKDAFQYVDTRVKPRVFGKSCDVCKVGDVQALAEYAVQELGSIDIWINNAGVNKGFRPMIEFSDEDIEQIVSANLIGSLLCSREAVRVMRSQPKGGHVFNMDGSGSGGSSTPLTAVYGSTKCGLRQLHTSLLQECKRSRVGIHTASPGMVLTDLLLSGASLQNKKMFNFICELPETVAHSLVPRMRDIKGTGKAVNYLTPPRILMAIVSAWVRRGRWFDEEGQAVYAAEAERLRNWAEDRTRFSASAVMDQFSSTTLVSAFSISALCAFIMVFGFGSTTPGI